MIVKRLIPYTEEAPSRFNPVNFSPRADYLADYISRLPPDIGQMADEFNATAATVNNLEQSASNSANIAGNHALTAQSASKYKGLFVPGSTNAVAGDSWGYQGFIYTALVNTSTTPSPTNQNWYSAVAQLSDDWNSSVNYKVGQEVIRNGLRYIARAASGPTNGGAVEPLFTNDATKYWNEKINEAHIRRYPQNEWVKILAFPAGSTQWQGVTLELIGGDNRGFFEGKSIFHVDVYVNRESDAPSAPIKVRVIPRNIGIDSPTLHTRISGGVSELWVKTTTNVPRPLVVLDKTAYSVPPSLRVEVGILEAGVPTPTGLTLVPYDTGYQFASIPIGMEVAFDTPPPTNDPRFRFVTLTYNDAYNTGLLTSQTLSGSAPELVSTAVISDTRSPINGQTISLINTMGTFIRPGVTAGVRQISGNKSHAHSLASSTYNVAPGGGATVLTASGSGASTHTNGDDESKPYNESRVFYKRIY
jgi:hypothetical protein